MFFMCRIDAILHLGTMPLWDRANHQVARNGRHWYIVSKQYNGQFRN